MAGNVATAGQLTGAEGDGADALDYSDTDGVDKASDIDGDDKVVELNGFGEEPSSPASARTWSSLRLAAVMGSVVFVVLAGLIGWLGFTEYRSHQVAGQQELFLQAARQGAVNMTTIDWQKADADVRRIVDSATGTFHDDFSLRSQPFVDVVLKAQSKSVGTVTEAAMETISGDKAEVLVVVSVKTTMPNQPESEPRSWRLRISVQKMDNGEAKISNVVFVP